MNTLQKILLSETISWYLNEISELKNPLDAIIALKAVLQKNKLNQKQKNHFRHLDVYLEIKQLRKILAHPCPQNITTGSPYVGLGELGVDTNGLVLFEPLGHGNGIAKEQQGILGLTSRDDALNKLKLDNSKGNLPRLKEIEGLARRDKQDTYYLINYEVTKEDIANYIEAKIITLIEAKKETFQPDLDPLAVKKLMQLVVSGEEETARKMLEANPHLIFQAAMAVTSGGMILKHAMSLLNIFNKLNYNAGEILLTDYLNDLSKDVTSLIQLLSAVSKLSNEYFELLCHCLNQKIRSMMLYPKDQWHYLKPQRFLKFFYSASSLAFPFQSIAAVAMLETACVSS